MIDEEGVKRGAWWEAWQRQTGTDVGCCNSERYEGEGLGG